MYRNMSLLANLWLGRNMILPPHPPHSHQFDDRLTKDLCSPLRSLPPPFHWLSCSHCSFIHIRISWPHSSLSKMDILHLMSDNCSYCICTHWPTHNPTHLFIFLESSRGISSMMMMMMMMILTVMTGASQGFWQRGNQQREGIIAKLPQKQD